MLWNYLNHVIYNWNGEIVIMGDFNKVRSKDERYGSLFNSHSVAAFNSFISLGEGFDKLFEETWRESTISASNAISKFMKKLKFLKEKIRLWTKAKKESSKSQKLKLKGMLSDVDSLIDNMNVDHELLNKRSYVMDSLHDLEKQESSEIAQKVKIKWSIEGDENSKYFHRILNKKRNQLAIRGILVDGVWNDSPSMVKTSFYRISRIVLIDHVHRGYC
ncbi:hypothetical protein Tco_1020177 [Tanacetum coccineum]|uniref:RNA-directed DNA polymerase, eukaryota n=1 Tax=Tanacetum coccineum TaxID=301880 RepID=A0ABQ5G151_9ASTR